MTLTDDAASRSFEAGRRIRAMLSDIEFEVAATRQATGLSSLDPRVMAAMAKVPRERFVPESYRHAAFDNGALPIGHAQTISQPFIVALMSDLLGCRPGHRILEIGTGSGYQTAVLAELAGHVYSIEIVAPLAGEAARRLAELGYRNVTLRQGDGYHGWPEQAPFDGIIVTAAAAELPPPLLGQLKPGARLVIPLGQRGFPQQLMLFEKREGGACDSRKILGVAFVPLTRADAGGTG